MNRKLLGLVYVTLFSLAWAIQTIINKIAINKGIEPISFSYQTLFGASIILIVYISFTQFNNFKKIEIKSIPKLAIIGILGDGFTTILTFYALKYSTSINYGFIIKSTLIFSIILAFIFLKEKINLKKIILMFTLLIGAYLISTKGQTIYPKMGDLIILATAFFFSSSNVIARPILKKYSPEIVSLFKTFSGGLIILIVSPFIISQFYVIENVTLFILRSIFVFLTVLFLNKTIETTSVSYMVMMSMMYSIFVTILGYIILNESMTIVQAIGGLLIIVSVILIQKSKNLNK